MSAKLYLMLGYPGAGKTTTAKYIEELTGARRLSSDEMRFKWFGDHPTFSQEEHDELYQKLDRTTEDLLKSGISVIYDANLNRRQHREEKYDICKQVGAESVLLRLRTPRELAKERAVHEDRSHFAVPNETLSHMFDRIVGVFEPPKEDENAIVVNGSDVTIDSIRKIFIEHDLLDQPHDGPAPQ